MSDSPGRKFKSTSSVTHSVLACRYVLFGYFVKDIADFGASTFKLPFAEAVAMDPQARILLEQMHEALSEAGQAVSHSDNAPSSQKLLDGSVGVYIGCMYTEYLDNILVPQVIIKEFL